MKSRFSIATVVALSVSLMSLAYAGTTTPVPPVGGSVFIVECTAQYSNPADIFNCVSLKCAAIHLGDPAGYIACLHNAGY